MPRTDFTTHLPSRSPSHMGRLSAVGAAWSCRTFMKASADQLWPELNNESGARTVSPTANPRGRLSR
jgi:hypothetical protein